MSDSQMFLVEGLASEMPPELEKEIVNFYDETIERAKKLEKRLFEVG